MSDRKKRSHSQIAFGLHQLNISGYIQTKDIVNDDVGERVIQLRMNEISDRFPEARITFKKNVWRAPKDFLSILGLTAKELVLINARMNMENYFGADMADTSRELTQFILEKKTSPLYIQSTLEKLSPGALRIFHRLKKAIDENRKIDIRFQNLAQLAKGERDRTVRRIQPFKIFTRGYYWYFAGYEESKTDIDTGAARMDSKMMKTYTLRNINKVSILDEKVDHDFSLAHELLPYATNGYVAWDEEPKPVEILVKDTLAESIQKAEAFAKWEKKTSSIAMPNHIIFHTKSVAQNFEDVVPLILQHMPYMIVRSPIELKNAINNRIEFYMAQNKLENNV